MKSKKAAAAFCGSCFFADKPQRFKLQFAEDLPVEESVKHDKIEWVEALKAKEVSRFERNAEIDR